MKRLQKRQQNSSSTRTNPIRAAFKPEKKITMFIGSVDKINTVQDIISHMSSYDIVVDPSEISEIPQRSDNKAFKVTIGKSSIETLKVIWPEGVKVDVHRAVRKVVASNKFKKPYNKKYVPKQPFRRASGYAPKTNQNWSQWQGNTRERPALPRAEHAYDYTWERPQQESFPYRDSPYYNSHFEQAYQTFY